MAHTKGPWKVVNSKIISTAEWYVEPGPAADDYGIPLSVVDLYGAMGGEDTAADARLMALAPEMLEGLRMALAELRGERTAGDWGETVASLESLIREAEGG